MDKLFIGIDPGMNGGVTFIKKEEQVYQIKPFRCPRDAKEMAGILEVPFATGQFERKDVILFIEHVWSFPGDGRVGAFRFGYNYGLWKGIASAFGLDIYNIPPKKWMYSFDMPSKMQSRERKRWLKELAESLYPNTKITFNTSDSVLIAHYAMECYNNDDMPESEEGVGVIK